MIIFSSPPLPAAAPSPAVAAHRSSMGCSASAHGVVWRLQHWRASWRPASTVAGRLAADGNRRARGWRARRWRPDAAAAWHAWANLVGACSALALRFPSVHWKLLMAQTASNSIRRPRYEKARFELRSKKAYDFAASDRTMTSWSASCPRSGVDAWAPPVFSCVSFRTAANSVLFKYNKFSKRKLWISAKKKTGSFAFVLCNCMRQAIQSLVWVI